MIILVVNITALFQLSEHSVGSSSNVIQDFLFSYLQSYSDSEFPPQFKCRDVSTLQEIVFDMDTPSLLSPNKEILFRVKYFDMVDAVCLYDDGDVFSTGSLQQFT